MAWKFLVFRSSIRNVDYKSTQPCPEAVQEDFTFIDFWPITDVKDIPRQAKYGPYDPVAKKIWTNIGENHQVLADGIQRELPTKGWFVEFQDQADLKTFINTYSPVRIWKEARPNPAFAELEIIDVIEQGI